MKKQNVETVSIVDYGIPREIYNIILNSYLDSVQDLASANLVCGLWHTLAQPKLNSIKQRILENYLQNALEMPNDVFFTNTAICLKLDKIKCYPILQKALGICIRQGDLILEMGFQIDDTSKRDKLFKILEAHYPFAYLFNEVFWDLLYTGTADTDLIGVLSMLKAIEKLILLHPNHEVLKLINLFHSDSVEFDTTFTTHNGVVFCGAQTIDALADDLLTELTLNAPSCFSRYRARKHLLETADHRAIELLALIGNVHVNHELCCTIL